MAEVSVRGLRNHGGDVLEAMMQGESVTVTRYSKPVAELRPISESGTDARDLLERWRGVPVFDIAGLRSDLDEILDPLTHVSDQS
jgi:prevent-host-death family protein